MSDNNSTAHTLEDPCINCPRTSCNGCPNEPVLLTTPFFIDPFHIEKQKKPKKKSWIEKQIARRGWK